MASKEFIERLKLKIERVHNCVARHSGSLPVKEVLNGQTVWEGDVEVFFLDGHPKAKRCYGWSFGEPEEFITVLELNPVDSPETAVKVAAAYQTRKGAL